MGEIDWDGDASAAWGGKCLQLQHRRRAKVVPVRRRGDGEAEVAEALIQKEERWPSAGCFEAGGCAYSIKRKELR